METIHSRYNRLSHHALYLMLIVAFLAGIGLVRLVFVDWLKMDRGEGPQLFQEHPNLAVWTFFGSLPTSTLSLCYAAYRLWGRRDAEGCLELHAGYAVVRREDREFRVERNELPIRLRYSPTIAYGFYLLRTPRERMALIPSQLEGKERKRRKGSLDGAMKRLGEWVVEEGMV